MRKIRKVGRDYMLMDVPDTWMKSRDPCDRISSIGYPWWCRIKKWEEKTKEKRVQIWAVGRKLD